MSRASTNYLEELARLETPLGISEEPPGKLAGELVQPQPPDASITPELQSYIRQCVIDTVAQAMTTTVIPEVVKSTLAQANLEQAKPEQVSTAMETPPTPSLPLVPQSHPKPVPYYETPVPTLHTTYQPHNKQHLLANAVCWGAVTVIVGIMGGLAFFSIRQSPQTQTVQQNQQLNQSNQALSERLVESNAQVLESKQRCGNFSLICNIKE